jgi:hypothetical protein
MGSTIRKHTEMPLQQVPALGARVICDIPLTSDLENVLIALSGTLTTGATAPTGLKGGGITELIQQVELIGDGRDVIASMPFDVLCNGNMFRRKNGNQSSITQPGLLASTVYNFEAETVLDLSQFSAIRPKDSALRENNYKTLQIAFRYAGDWSTVFINGATAGVVASSNIAVNPFALPASSLSGLVVTAKESVELADATGAASAPVLRALYSARDDQVSGATTRQRFRLTPDQYLRGITLRTKTNTPGVPATDGLLSNSLLSRVRVYVGKDLRTDLSSQMIRERNGIEVGALTNPNGYYYIDFADGNGSPDKINDALNLMRDVTQGADCYLEYDTVGACTTNVTQWGLIPV